MEKRALKLCKVLNKYCRACSLDQLDYQAKIATSLLTDVDEENNIYSPWGITFNRNLMRFEVEQVDSILA